jgi:predicted nucleic acid-binding Zn ribbon protein
VTRRAPRPVAFALEQLTETLAPATPLAAVQRVWEQVVGADVAAQASPTGLRAGVLTVTCRASVWAQELELMGPELVARLNAELGSEEVLRLRCKATPA